MFYKFFLVKPLVEYFKTFLEGFFICRSFQSTPFIQDSWQSYIYRSSRPEVFLEKGILKICSKFTGGHPCRSVISIKLQNSFIEIPLRHGCSPVNLLHIFRTPFLRNTSGWLLLYLSSTKFSANKKVSFSFIY